MKTLSVHSVIFTFSKQSFNKSLDNIFIRIYCAITVAFNLKLLSVPIQRAQSVLDKKYQRTAFFNYCRSYIFEICALCDMQILVEKNRPLLCFLVLLLFQYLVIRNTILDYQLYNQCIMLWPNKWYKII